MEEQFLREKMAGKVLDKYHSYLATKMNKLQNAGWEAWESTDVPEPQYNLFNLFRPLATEAQMVGDTPIAVLDALFGNS